MGGGGGGGEKGKYKETLVLIFYSLAILFLSAEYQMDISYNQG